MIVDSGDVDGGGFFGVVATGCGFIVGLTDADTLLSEGSITGDALGLSDDFNVIEFAVGGDVTREELG